MKKILIIGAVLVLASCKKESVEPFGTTTKTETTTESKTETTATPIALGKALFEEKGGCVACHRVEAKLIGPSLQEIAKNYKEKNGNLIALLKDEAEPIMDPSQFAIMKASLGITKAMSEEELKNLEAYIYSNLK